MEPENKERLRDTFAGVRKWVEMFLLGAGGRAAGGPSLASLVLVLMASWALSGHPGPAHATATRCEVRSTCMLAFPAQCPCRVVPAAHAFGHASHLVTQTCLLRNAWRGARHLAAVPQSDTAAAGKRSHVLRTGRARARARVAGPRCPRACAPSTLPAAVPRSLPWPCVLSARSNWCDQAPAQFLIECGRQTGRRGRRGG